MAAQRSSAKVKKSAPAKRNPPAAKRTKPASKAVAAKTKPVAKVKPTAAPAASKKSEKPEPKIKIPTNLTKAELAHYRALLLEKRREILGDVGTMESEAFKAGSNLSNMPIHMADVGTDNFEQEFTLGLIESERRILREIQEALGRIEEGTYGICLGTGKPIPKVRLEAVPWAKYSLEYAKALESGAVRREASPQRDEDGGDEDEE